MPPIPVTGAVVLDGVTFTTNPEVYEPWNWRKRHSVHPTIGGEVVIQDFGTFMRDNTVRLASGNNQFLSEAAVTSFHAKWRTRGSTFSFSDWLGNLFTVFIKEFVPINYRPDLYRYTMELQVTVITNLWGTSYTGT